MDKEYYFIKCFEKGRENDFLVQGRYSYCWTHDIFEATRFDDLKHALDEIKFLHDNYSTFDFDINPVKANISIEICS